MAFASDLLQSTQKQALDLAAKAQDKAKEVAQQAQDFRNRVDIDMATNILMSTLGASSLDYNSEALYRSSKGGKELDLVYMTENIIGMAFPNDPAKLVNTEGPSNNIHDVSRFLLRRHEGHFMVWNVSEETYNTSLLADQVLEYKFPGHPAPPLGLLFKICTAVESWLDADEQNVAVVHCLTGKGRTAALVACILTWIGEFASPMEALQYVADRKATATDVLTIPSQRRYVHYFSNMLDGVRPRPEALLLRRVIINSIPTFGDDGTGAGCCPYVQLFKGGRLIATAAPPSVSVESADGSGAAAGIPDSAPSTERLKSKLELKWIRASEGSVSFPVDCAVQGDILLRVRHADNRTGARVSMFRAAFHTGYVPCGVLRLTKQQLDGSSTDPRFDESFFVDLIFAPIEKAVSDSNFGIGVPSDQGLLLDSSHADKYEQSLHKDTRFWDAVQSRKSRVKRRRPRRFAAATQEQFSIGGDDASPQGTTLAAINSTLSSLFSLGGEASSYNTDLISQLAEAEDGGCAEDAVPAASQETQASMELQALEELEKELGLELFDGPPAPAAAPAEGVSAAQAASDNDLDELEKYLESLSS